MPCAPTTPDTANLTRLPAGAVCEAGFSLVEVLVTLSITALASAMILATARPADALRSEAEQLSGVMQQLDARARLSGMPTGLMLEAAEYSGVVWQDGAWAPLPGSRHLLKTGVQVRAEPSETVPQVVFDPLGHSLADPVSLWKDGRESVVPPPGTERAS